MSEIREWVRLKCDCGGELFEPLVYLKFKSGGGTTTEPAGHRCIACTGVVDTHRMIRLVEINTLRQKLNEVEQEIEAKTPEVATKK